jgi:hypothetical protein
MSERFPVRLYRLLLRAYPRRFRERYGAEMTEDAQALLAQRRAAHGVWGVLSAWWLIARDLLRSAARERLLARRTTSTESIRRGDATMLVHDFRQGVRMLVRAPGFAAAAVLRRRARISRRRRRTCWIFARGAGRWSRSARWGRRR